MEPELSAFFQDALRLTKTIDLVVLVPHDTTDIPATRELIADLRTFHERWNGRVTDPQERAIVEHFHRQCLGHEREIEARYLVTLGNLIRARAKWLLDETFIKAQIAVTEVARWRPDIPLPKLPRRASHPDEEADPVATFRDSMTDADASEAAYRRIRDEIVACWPDRIGEPLFQSIDRDDLATATPLLEAAVQNLADPGTD